MTIRTIDPDPRTAALHDGASALGLADLGEIRIADVVHLVGDLDGDAKRSLHALLVDPLLQIGTWDTPTGRAVEIVPQPGVTDPGADAARHASEQLGIGLRHAATGLRVEFDEAIDDADVDELVRRLLANPIVDRWQHEPFEIDAVDDPEPPAVADVVPIRGADDARLHAIDTERSLALDPAELRIIRDHFEELGRDPTDVELETLAQTWSEHCAHKTFRAAVVVRSAGDENGADDESDGSLDGDEADAPRSPLLDRLRRCTDAIDAPFVKSAFVGNAGIVEFVPGTTLAVKAETHNHPSAVEPFGGANTGVGGVIRDVLGAAHRPIAVTDILCFGFDDLPLDELPDGSLHPRRIRAGVIDGVADYGNKIGLPTVAGAILYDPAYTTNPLVFAGCIGSAPSRALHDGPHAGDRILVLGGATGRDGIRGATFSSATMNATTGEVAGASVQIGDPIVEKLLIDALVGAEDLYSAITDCGAGGLSSAIGEMAEGVGADVDLTLVPRKYPGLAPWEVWLSEAQERMVIAVTPRNVSAIAKRCERVGLDWADVGHFTGDGVLHVHHAGTTVARLDTDFLHDGRPRRTMTAAPPTPRRGTPTSRTVDDPVDTLLRLLRHPNIASKEAVIHRYDHEILGSTVVRPLVGVAGDAPADGVVIAEPTAQHGIALGIGVNPWIGLHDPEAMAFAVVDEAIRNCVAVGADPDRVALLDNFSWGDPRRESTMGDLVAAVDGCCAAAYTFGAPFVSGKDSLNNEYIGADGERHAVPPTLVITAMAHVPDADRCVTPDLGEPGDVLFLLGTTSPEFAGSHLDLVLGEPDDPGVAPSPDPDAPDNYRRLHAAISAGLVSACHDVSEGGLAVALAEMCIGGRVGAAIDTLPDDDLVTSLFSESIGRLLISVSPPLVSEFLRAMDDGVLQIGEVSASGMLTLPGVEPVMVDDLVDAFTNPDISVDHRSSS
ncbi:MAG: phosphoribosylformylglycinamidine synthase subunit PurL [Actinomycetota bacterium]